MSELPKYDRQKTWTEQDFQVSARLHLQHLIWSSQLGYVLHPGISIPPGQDVRIADVACGNGAWLLDAARQHANGSFDGFDLTVNNVPSSGWLPSNCRFHAWDVFSDVPAEFVGVFDVVHIRAVYSLVIDNQVEKLASNLIKMLKPGGFLQWDEADLPTFRCQVPSDHGPAKATSALVVIFNMFMIQRNKMSGEWLHSLPSTLQKGGCEMVANDRIIPQPQLQRMWCDNFLTLFLSIAPNIPETDVPLPRIEGVPETLSRNSYLDLLSESAKECAQGAWLHHESIVFVARKT